MIYFKISKYEILNHIYFDPSFVFLGLPWDCFQFYVVGQLWWQTFLLSTPPSPPTFTLKKLPIAQDLHRK